MKNRTAVSGRAKVSRIAVTLAAAAVTLTACDSAVGIQGNEPSPPATSSASPSTTEPPVTTTPTAPPPPIPVGPPVGEAPGNPDAAAALRPFVADLTTGGLGLVTARCWTVPPTKIPTMYSDPAALLAAAAVPGVDSQFAVTWTGPVSTVSVKRSEIASGYACPTVYPTGTAPTFDAVDAVWAVDRYLGRFTGQPVNRADLEGDYRLVCENQQTWDPAGTGSPTVPPLANNPGNLTGSTSYVSDSVFVTAQNGTYTEVNADVTNSSGVVQNRTFVLAVGGEGYCIGDVV